MLSLQNTTLKSHYNIPIFKCPSLTRRPQAGIMPYFAVRRLTMCSHSSRTSVFSQYNRIVAMPNDTHILILNCSRISHNNMWSPNFHQQIPVNCGDPTMHAMVWFSINILWRARHPELHFFHQSATTPGKSKKKCARHCCIPYTKTTIVRWYSIWHDLNKGPKRVSGITTICQYDGTQS